MANGLTNGFARVAQRISRQAGRASTFIVASLVVIGWAALGPLYGWSDTWQLIVNTVSSVVTFFMVFLIQNTQHRDTQAIQLKLDELLRVNEAARDALINLEDLNEDELVALKATFKQLRAARLRGDAI